VQRRAIAKTFTDALDALLPEIRRSVNDQIRQAMNRRTLEINL
jgi:hypothetical protein